MCPPPPNAKDAKEKVRVRWGMTSALRGAVRDSAGGRRTERFRTLVCALCRSSYSRACAGKEKSWTEGEEELSAWE